MRRTKFDIATAIAAEAGIGYGAAEMILNDTIEVLSDFLAGGDTVAVTGFGTLTPKTVGKRHGTGPTGAPFETDACVRVRFKQGAALGRRVNGGG